MNGHELVLGIDIGGTTTSFGFVDGSGRLLEFGVMQTEAELAAESLVERLHQRVAGMLGRFSATFTVKGIGIGAPNANHIRGTVENPPNLNWGESVNLVELFRRRFDLPVAITNDANAAALGEMYYGGARGMRDFIVVTLGTGLGSGIVTDGELVYGACGFAGELGHTVVVPGGRHCGCGKQGCLETYVSATGLCRTVFVLLAERRESSRLRQLSYQKLTAKDVFEAASDGDPIAFAAFEETGRILGMKLADAVAHTAPEAIFLSGGLTAAGDLLLGPTERSMEAFLFPVYRGKVRLSVSELGGGTGAVMGAAALVWHELEKGREPSPVAQTLSRVG
ncbi:MAG: ROK family protein [Desulfuromonadia bacterium]